MFKKIIMNLDLNLNGTPDIEEIKEKMDINKDGKLDVKDIVELVKRKVLERYDKNEDKELSAEEIIKICIDVLMQLKLFVK